MDSLKSKIAVVSGLVSALLFTMAFADTTSFDYATALAPLQTQAMQAITVGLGIAAAVFAVIYGVRKLMSIIRAVR